MAASLFQMAASITERSKTLINNDLKKILKEEGSAQTGNKAALQARVIGLIQAALANNDTERMRRLQFRVQNNGSAPSYTSSSPVAPAFSSIPPPAANGFNMSNGYQPNAQYHPAYQPQQPAIPPRPTYFFKESPFFEIRELLLSNISLEASPSHRQNTTRTLTPSDSVAARLKQDPTLRLLLFSGVETPLNHYTKLDITFPSQIEVKINGDEVKANYKGLKNKPGSTRPVDITDFVRITPANHRNNITITYALTQKKYNLFIYMVKKFSIDDLTKRIKQRNVITRQSVLQEMVKKANDPDIEVGSSVMSLKDPISTLRINTPCRSTICTHNQCFDAESFLQLQEQAPTWTCPICNKTVSFEALAIDQYVEEILAQARNADQVTIEPNGTWSIQKEPSPARNGYSHQHDDDSDDDIVELPADYRVRNIKNETALTPSSLSTPPIPSRETSSAPRSGQKRTSEVVDLTFSDDDEPPRPAKKVAYNTPSNVSDPSRRYHLPSLNRGSNSAAHSRPLPPSNNNYPSGMQSFLTRPSQTPPPPRPAYSQYSRPPAPSIPQSRYPGQGSSNYPTYLGSSP
ncbi:E3 SUMO-protein ligase pli1 [Coniothyrium glycines]